ncbi:L-fucose/L-arabinose isomerase family protein [Kosmotoga sp. DU53]|uniref:L-fucose/L-arabinose isomerase family protein n=1 Tax=Kosmotoga sp. DU53 TaxID=1310160 RepID=UPI0007C4434D|nr:L-fucose/L-arabinose isomerase family protein [Kosmotoga sp. DU53]OAA25564.1 fucose isomerase [Kosmotoga sp. DU53]
MNKRRVGIITFSDGREFVHKELLEMNKNFENRLVKALEETGEVEVVRASEIVWKPSLAKKAGIELLKSQVEITIFNYAIWCWPHLTVMASLFAPGPYLLYGQINPKYPGMVGLLAAAGALEQIGVFPERIWGEPENPEVIEKVLKFVRAASAVNRLKGERYGMFGGRPMGMYTAAANGDQWLKEFGIDVEQIDQYELVIRAEKVSAEKKRKGREWLEKLANVIYDGNQLTPEILERQIAMYEAAMEIINEYELDFVGFKGQPEMTNNYATMDVVEAFLNDPYDWNGPKEPIVAATETDMDGALTMEIFKHIAQTPVLFADVRHYFEDENILDLCNSGTHATYFAGKSFDPEVNLKKVTLYPETFYFPAGGAAVKHFAVPGRVTMARLARQNGKYVMTIVPGEFLELPEDAMEELAKDVQIEWPHAYMKLDTDMETFLRNYPCNHIHGVYGDCVEELIYFCQIKGIEYRILGSQK